MSYDGSGTYSLPSPEYPAVPGALIKAADFNTIMLDLAAALSLCLVRDGQALATGNLNMNSKKIVGLAAGSSPGDAVRFEQLPAALTAALTALNALTPAADKFPFFTAADAADQLTIVAAVRAVLAAADVSAMRTAMGVAYGTTAGTVSEGDHLHTGVYQPAGSYAASGANADITSLSGLTTPLSVAQGGTGGATSAAARATLGVDTLSRRNRLCNGDFRVDNVSAGAIANPAATTYVVDNTKVAMSQGNKFNFQRQQTILPFSFRAYTANAMASPGAADYFTIARSVEGLDWADMGWGTASAQPCAVSFDIRVTVAGTYGFCIAGAGYSYVFCKTLEAGVLTHCTEIIPGCTVGTWNTGAAAVLALQFDLGSGSDSEATTANTWGPGFKCRVSGNVRLVSNAAAGYDIGNIQIEKGSFATPFEVLPYQQVLAWCQRYYYKWVAGVAFNSFSIGVAESSTVSDHIVQLPVPMRAIPSLSHSGMGAIQYYTQGVTGLSSIAISGYSGSTDKLLLTATSSGAVGSTASPVFLISNNDAASYIAFAAHL